MRALLVCRLHCFIGIGMVRSLYTYTLSVLLLAVLAVYSGPISQSSTVPAPVRIVLRSRVGLSLALWVAAQTIAIIALLGLPSPWAWWCRIVIGLLTIPFFAVVLFHTVRTRRRSIAQPFLDGFDESAMDGLVTPKITFGPGHDFPESPALVDDVKKARYYASTAQDRQTVREHVGMITRVVAGAFIATVAVWAIASNAAGGILLVLAVVLIMYCGHLIEIRARFYGALSDSYTARARELEEKAFKKPRWWQHLRASTD